MAVMISSSVFPLLDRVRELRKQIAGESEPEPERDVADLQRELDRKLDLLNGLLAAARPVPRKAEDSIVRSTAARIAL